MTRINLIPVSELTDQHLMAEYRELPMVAAAAKRSNPSTFIPKQEYTLNSGHVKFFFNKRQFLLDRWLDLIKELFDRGFNIDPASRKVDWSVFNKFEQQSWSPSIIDQCINLHRIDLRISEKPEWYRYRGRPIC